MSFTYAMKAHPTLYKGTMFRSRLEARYAAYFDLCGFSWEYEPIDFDGWTPDFKVKVPCNHSECSGSHTFWVEIKPYEHRSQFQDHACQRFNRPFEFSAIGLGLTPKVETSTEFCHGSGGGEEHLSNWVSIPFGQILHSNLSTHWQWIDHFWSEAGNRTRYQP